MRIGSLRNAAQTPADVRARRQRSRNRAVLLSLLALVVLIYLVSIVRMSGG